MRDAGEGCGSDDPITASPDEGRGFRLGVRF
jgi:hypothetical protein